MDKDANRGIDLYEYFSTSCYSDETSFFSVYSRVFHTLVEEELTYGDLDQEDVELDAPEFGAADTHEDDVRAFYEYWERFSTRKTYSWLDQWNPNDAPNRQVRRAIEKENNKLRVGGRKQFNNLVHELVAFVKKRDARVERASQRRREELDIRDRQKKQQLVQQRQEALRMKRGLCPLFRSAHA